MDPRNHKALALLDEIAKEPLPTGPVALDEDYLRAIELVEALPENQSGADKTWVVELTHRLSEQLRSVERVR